MLVLSRFQGEEVVITTPSGEEIRVHAVEIRPGCRKVRLGFTAPRNFTIHRQEIAELIAAERAAEKEPARLPA